MAGHEPMGKIVSSVEFEKDFERYREIAHREPVTIADAGNEELVLLSVGEYRRLKQLDRQTLYAWELDQETLNALERDDIPEEAAKFDHEFG